MATRFRKYLRILPFTILFVVVGGYRFGTGDHVSQLPTVLHFFNPDLYSADFGLQLIFPWYVKSGLFIALAYLSRLLHLPLEYLFFVVYLAVLFYYLLVFDELLSMLKVREEVRNLALLLLLPFSYLFVTISHFHLVTLRLVPYFFVLPLCIKAIILFLRNKFLPASVFCALAFYVHQQLGLIIFGTIFFAALIERIWGRLDARSLFQTILPFLALFLVHFMFMQFMGSYRGYPWFDPAWGRELLEMVKFRVPHHLLLSYSGWLEMSLFLVVALFSAVGIRFLAPEKALGQRLGNMSAGLLTACFAGFIFTEIYPLPVVLNLYLFRSDVILRVIAFSAFILLLDRCVSKGRLYRPVVALFFLTALVGGTLCIYKKNIRIFIPENEVVAISRCIRNKTPISAFLLASPAIKGLRLYSERSVFVSWKSHGLFFPPDIARQWFHRMMLLCGMRGHVSCQGSPCRKICGRNYASLSTRELLHIATDYNIDYLLVGPGRELGLEKVCTSKNYVLYRLK